MPAPLYNWLDAKNTSPGVDAVAVTPSDVADLAVVPARFLLISVAGAIKVTMVSGNQVTIPNVPVGQLNLQVTRVWATGTAATGITAVY
jgi:hypothetical protein